MYTATERKLPLTALNQSTHSTLLSVLLSTIRNQKEDVPKFNKPGRLNIVDDLLQKIRELVIETRLPGAVISRRMVISIVNKFLKANDPNTLSEFGRTITLTDDSAGGILQSVD